MDFVKWRDYRILGAMFLTIGLSVAAEPLPSPSVTVMIDNKEWPGHTWMVGTCKDKSIFMSFGPGETKTRIERIHTESTHLYETGEATSQRTFMVTAEQCERMFDKMEGQTGTMYDLLLNNCTTAVIDVLKAGGIVIPPKSEWDKKIEVSRKIISPSEFEKKIQEFEQPKPPPQGLIHKKR